MKATLSGGKITEQLAGQANLRCPFLPILCAREIPRPLRSIPQVAMAWAGQVHSRCQLRPYQVSWLLNFLVTTLPSSRPRRSAIFWDKSWWELPLKILIFGILGNYLDALSGRRRHGNGSQQAV